MSQKDESQESWWESDVDVVTTEDIFHNEKSENDRVGFEASFFTLILTILLAYPEETRIYDGLKALLILFAILTITRRMVVMTDFRENPERFMRISKGLMTDISALGLIYLFSKVSVDLLQYIPFLDFVGTFILTTLSVTFLYLAFVTSFAKDDLLLEQIIHSTRWANNSPIHYWRRRHRNLAIKRAKRIERPDEELPEKVVELRRKEERRTIPFPEEIPQFLHGFILRVVRASLGAFIGWMIFEEIFITIAAWIGVYVVGGQIHRLYRRYGLEGYGQRMHRISRRVIQSLAIIAAHPILLSYIR